MTIIATAGVCASYGARTAVDEVSINVGEAECVALVGANGAGKSTLLRVIAGIRPPRRGTVRLYGKDVTGWSARTAFRHGVVLCPEGRQLFPHMTVHENLLLGLGGGRRERALQRERLDEVEDLFPVLRGRARQAAGTLSGGEQQMVALGRALMSHPRLLILDEPSLGLAPLLVDQVFSIIEKLVTSKRSVLVAEQNVEASLTIAGRAYVLEAGRVTANGTPAELQSSPALMRAFLG